MPQSPTKTLKSTTAPIAPTQETTTMAQPTPITQSTKAPRLSRSTREWLDAAGKPIEEESDIGGAVRGFSYHYKPANRAITRLWTTTANSDGSLSLPAADMEEVMMYAAFGGLTLMGNVASGKDANPAQAFTDMESRANLIKGGTWVERVGGPRWNLDILARAISIVKHGDERGTAEALAKLNGPPLKVKNLSGALVDMPYSEYARSNPDVIANYHKLNAKATIAPVSAGDL